MRTWAAAGRVDVNAGRKYIDARSGVAEGVVALRVAEVGGVELGCQIAARHADGLPHVCCTGAWPHLIKPDKGLFACCSVSRWRVSSNYPLSSRLMLGQVFNSTAVWPFDNWHPEHSCPEVSTRFML